jgi:DNA repair ATPase RecN
MTEMAVLLGGEVPETLEAINESFPAMIDTARVIDRTMSALSILGVDYSPEVPLDRSLQDVEDQLGPLAITLRQQAIPLAEAASNLETVGGSVRTVGHRVNEITTQLTGSTRLVERYQAAASEASTLVEDLRERLLRQLALARGLLIVLGLILLVVMTVPIALGRSVAASRLEQGV